jgi:hypothetical protein
MAMLLSILLFFIALLLHPCGSSIAGGQKLGIARLDALGRSDLIDRLRRVERSASLDPVDSCILPEHRKLPEHCEGLIEELVDKSTKWWVAEGRKKYPHVEAMLIRKAKAEADRKEKMARDKVGYCAESGLWAHPLIRPWWYMLPFYYKFDFDTCLYVMPLRAHPLDKTLRTRPVPCGAGRELVTEADLTKKLFKCAYKGQTKRVRACVRAGALINASDFNHPEHLTPLLWASAGGFPHTLEALAELGGNLEARSRSGHHALHIAAAKGHVQAISAIFNITDGNLYARDNQERACVCVCACVRACACVRVSVCLCVCLCVRCD